MASVKKFGANEGLVRSTSFGRKRVALSDVCMVFENDEDCIPITPVKRRCFDCSIFGVRRSALEDLPQEILIRVLCGVEHDDLKSLVFVSKSIREAALIAKQSHFAYSTPRKNFKLCKAEDFADELGAPNAPKQSRIQRSRLNAKKLSDISVSLFASDDDYGCWDRRNLFHEARIEI